MEDSVSALRLQQAGMYVKFGVWGMSSTKMDKGSLDREKGWHRLHWIKVALM